MSGPAVFVVALAIYSTGFALVIRHMSKRAAARAKGSAK